MPLSPEESQRLAELEELDALRSHYGQSPQQEPADDGKAWEAAGTGALQGATLGFSDELGATGDVISDFFTKNPAAKSWREYQQSREAANKQLQQAHPFAYGAGEVGGGLATALVPGVGAAKGAATLGRALKTGWLS